MIELIPAIDIIDGHCVRLCMGDYASKKVYATNPVAMAQEFEQIGFKRLHIVDLDGAKSQHVVNLNILQEICRKTNLAVDFGGGVKTDQDLRLVFEAGAQMATAGSIAISHPELFLEWLAQYGPDRLILGADVRNDRISINGWCEDSDTHLLAFLDRYIKAGTRKVLCTDICRDGMLQGPATELYASVMSKFPDCHLIASGGVSCVEDIRALNEANIPAVVFGKALYEGRIDVKALKSEFLC